MKIFRIAIAALFALLMTNARVTAADDIFKATLSGGEEKTAVASKTTGDAIFTLSADGKELAYALTVKDIEDAVAAHVHAGKKGAEGPPVVGLFGGAKKVGKFSGELAKGTITDKNLVGPLYGKTIADLVSLIKSGDAYVNVHTAKNPGGEIRGQVQ
jgi:hypothetical protein